MLERSIEKSSHFKCSFCSGSFSVINAPDDKHAWFCPWCGTVDSYLSENELRKLDNKAPIKNVVDKVQKAMAQAYMEANCRVCAGPDTGYIYCEHANEVPQHCPCYIECICRHKGSCKYLHIPVV